MTLARLARAAGLAVRWTDATGARREVSPQVQRAVLAALGYPAGGKGEIAESLARLVTNTEKAPLAVLHPGEFFSQAGRARLLAEDGTPIDLNGSDGMAAAPAQPGYYLREDGTRLAVVPERAHVMPAGRRWGVAAQLYALQGGTTKGFGDFAALGAFVEDAAQAGADAVAISPVHALFGSRPDHISPYAPSSRLFLNPLFAAVGRKTPAPLDISPVNWPVASRSKWAALRRDFRAFQSGGHGREKFADFVRLGGARLLAHARFEVLEARFAPQTWQQWQAEFRTPNAPGVAPLGQDDDAVQFQLFVQWRAQQDLAAAQMRARAGGMAVGLITDMAVGMDPAGSHAWSNPAEVLRGLSVGAPPDIYNQAGQNWGLTNFSPQGLRASGYEGFIGTLRAAMGQAGGIRLDHAMGLKRLWVVPEGAAPGEGVYLHYPFEEMLGLLTLESRRNQAIVIAEDLGTVPRGFRRRIARAGLLGMRVLWFERRKGGFLPPSRWDAGGAALSTTHDLPTLAGWWRGRDLDWQARIQGDTKAITQQRAERRRDRRKLWKTLQDAGTAQGAPPGETAPQGFADAALAALARTPCPLLLAPVEDFAGDIEQPNIPGTIDEHPNWRRRMKTAQLFAAPAARRRAALLRRERP